MTSNVTSQGPAAGQNPEVDFVSLQPGQTIGRYEILAVLGQGGFGITYRARDDQLGREVAIKEYLPTALAVRQGGITVLPRSTKLADDFTWGRQRFVEEGRTLATLQRAPAIVRVFDFLEANGTAYIVMELAPGETLESRLKRVGTLGPAEVDRILWPLLDGLEQVHNAGYLHRDIKPANILLDDEGNPTLIDFGASRTAIAGRTAAMTTIFTPGYAAPEQMTSARQGAWADIYGISATIYHAITGEAPPSAFDRMIDDTYQPLAKLAPAGFAPGLVVGIDAGMCLRASDRPQSIAGWRPLLGQAAAPDGQATVALARPASAPTVISPRATAIRAPAKRGTALWLGVGAAVLLLLGGGYYLATRPSVPAVTAEQKAVEAKAEQQRQELERLRADVAAREKLEQEAALRRQIEEETRKKVESDLAEKRRLDEEARRQAEGHENSLRMVPPERQRVQAALTSLGFDTGGIDGVFNPRTREMIANWQRGKGYLATGFLTPIQHQALLREAAPALARFDEDQRKAAEAARKLEEDRARAATLPSQAAIAPPAASAPPVGADGPWRGTYHCTPSRGGGEFTMNVHMTVASGVGTWVRPGSGPGTVGNQSLSIKISGSQVVVSRVHAAGGQAGVFTTGTMNARHENGMITGTGPEQNSGGRTCTINLTR
jgi:serine/threonine protein kinase/peptidoglycan hydrolase-like protein with peptidoglycan-binding domain